MSNDLVFGPYSRGNNLVLGSDAGDVVLVLGKTYGGNVLELNDPNTPSVCYATMYGATPKPRMSAGMTTEYTGVPQARARSPQVITREGVLTVSFGWTPGPLPDDGANAKHRPYVALVGSGTARSTNLGIPQNCPMMRFGGDPDVPDANGRRYTIAVGVSMSGDDFIVSDPDHYGADVAGLRPGGGGWLLGTTYQVDWVIDWAAGETSADINGNWLLSSPRALIDVADPGPYWLEFGIPGVATATSIEKFSNPRVDRSGHHGVTGGDTF